MGPSRVEPLYGEVFARQYKPPFDVQVWSLDVLTSYVVQVPKMVCFCGLLKWPPFSSSSLYKKGFAAFQRLPLSAFAQLLGYSD